MFVFKIPVPASPKNSRIIVRGRGRPTSLPSKAARKSVEQIRAAAFRALDSYPELDGALFADHDVGVEITHHVEDDTCTVKVWSLGPRPKGKTGRKRDLQNLQEGILDTLQGIAFNHDNQVCLLQMKRVIEKAPPRWETCEDCGEFWCSWHNMHAADCNCPAVDEMDLDPYAEG